MNFNPFPVLTTADLVLRPLTLDDVDVMFQLRSDAEICKYIARPLFTERSEAQYIIQFLIAGVERNEWVHWGISYKNDKALLGTICLWNIEKEHFRAEIGFELLPRYQGKGIMFQAAQAVLQYAFNVLNLHSIQGTVQPENQASSSLLKRLGFRQEAHFKENIFYNGNFLDTAVYSLLRSSFVF